MSSVKRISITLDKAKAAKIEELVSQGLYTSVSGAFDAAADALLDLEIERAAWWQETARRCDEAEKSPGILLSAEDFHTQLWSEIERRKKARAK